MKNLLRWIQLLSEAVSMSITVRHNSFPRDGRMLGISTGYVFIVWLNWLSWEYYMASWYGIPHGVRFELVHRMADGDPTT